MILVGLYHLHDHTRTPKAIAIEAALVCFAPVLYTKSPLLDIQGSIRLSFHKCRTSLVCVIMNLDIVCFANLGSVLRLIRTCKDRQISHIGSEENVGCEPTKLGKIKRNKTVRRARPHSQRGCVMLKMACPRFSLWWSCKFGKQALWQRLLSRPHWLIQRNASNHSVQLRRLIIGARLLFYSLPLKYVPLPHDCCFWAPINGPWRESIPRCMPLAVVCITISLKRIVQNIVYKIWISRVKLIKKPWAYKGAQFLTTCKRSVKQCISSSIHWEYARTWYLAPSLDQSPYFQSLFRRSESYIQNSNRNILLQHLAIRQSTVHK